VTLIDELMDMAHLRAGLSLGLRLEPVDIVALAAEAAAAARQRSFRHVIRVEGESPTLIGHWDRARLERVLTNLLDSAVKYSPDGSEVIVRVGCEEDASGVWAVLAVADRGVGIPAADLSRIFERFQRGGNVAEIAGAGVGLAGARQIVTQHGGTITVASEEGVGSTFTVRLPLESR
jgi:signal transduction histidine kinase